LPFNGFYILLISATKIRQFTVILSQVFAAQYSIGSKKIKLILSNL